MKSLHTLAPIQHPTTPHELLSSTPGIPHLNVGTSIPESNSESDSTNTLPLIIKDQPKFEISDILDAKI